ncbi:unnamed protein product, partial [Arabidopsis halleri]
MVKTDFEVAEDDEDLVQEKDSAAPKNFEVGSGSGEARVGVVLDLPITQAPPVGIQQTPATDNLPVIKQGEQALDGMGEDDGLSDWADEENYWEEENQEERVADEANDNQAFDSVPSDWENLANEEVEEEVASDKEITEEDMRLMKELENEMILDGLLEGDDLLGEELMDVDQDVLLANSEASPERTISEQVIPVSHPAVQIPATTQSPTSKRSRSPSKERARRSGRINGALAKEKSPSKLNGPLQPFHGKGSPKRRGQTPAGNSNIP